MFTAKYFLGHLILVVFMATLTMLVKFVSVQLVGLTNSEAGYVTAVLVSGVIIGYAIGIFRQVK